MTHPIPAAIDAMLDLARLWAAEQDRPVRIDDGPPVEDLALPDAIGIGLSVQDVLGASSTSTDRYAGEVVVADIVCVVQSWSGGIDLPERRLRVYEVFDAFRALLRAHPDLGGAVVRARISRHTYRPLAAEQQTLAFIDFMVQVEAHRPYDDEE